MRYYLVAGEASGDLHGSNLMKEIKKQDAEADFRFWGGDLMAAQGGTLVSHYRERAFMGLWEVIRNLRTIRGFLKWAKTDLATWKPDAVILIDNPGFNMRLAKFAHACGFPVHYYIAPKVWAWNTGRVKNIRKYVGYLYSILPFEPEFFAKHQVPVDYVGNPVVDAIQQFTKEAQWAEKKGISKPVIALLPGSRRNEIQQTLPVMASLAADFPAYEFVVAAAPGYKAESLQQLAGNIPLKIVENETYQLLSHSTAALVASGTATLETAAFRVPQVVCYRVAGLTWTIGKMVVKVKWVSLVNLILNRELVKEMLQDNFNRENLKQALKAILEGPGRAAMLSGYDDLNRILGEPGASARAASLMVQRIKNLHRT